MKIYLYRKFLNQINIEKFYKDIGLSQHYLYFLDFIEFFKKHETSNPEDADFYFIPLFIIGFQFANIDPEELILSCEWLHRGNHLLLTTGDYGQRSRSATEAHTPHRAYKEIYKWLDEKFILLAFESTSDLNSRDIGIFPYPLNIDTKVVAEKKFFTNFVGKTGYEDLPDTHIRGKRFELEIVPQFLGQPVGSLDYVNSIFGFSSYADYMKSSYFTICPAGYGRWTFRYIEALIYGSIPVIISDGFILPFSKCIDWSEFVIIYPENSIIELKEFLSKIPIGTVLQKLKKINENKSLFMRESFMNLLGKTLDQFQHVIR